MCIPFTVMCFENFIKPVEACQLVDWAVVTDVIGFLLPSLMFLRYPKGRGRMFVLYVTITSLHDIISHETGIIIINLVINSNFALL